MQLACKGWRKHWAGAAFLGLALIIGSAAAYHSFAAHDSAKTHAASLYSTAALQTPNPRQVAAMGERSLRFEPNLGQTDSQVKFVAHGADYALFLTSDEAVFSMAQPNSVASSPSRRKAARPASSSSVLRMRMLGATPRAMHPAEPTEGRSNYFIGRDASKWVSGVPQYSRVNYDELYPGVDATFYGQDRMLEFDYIVKPGAHPEQIALGFTGTRRVETNSSGDLVLASEAGDLHLKKPVAYQQQDGKRTPVDVQFVARNNNEVGLEIGAYDHSRELVIDPAIVYSTFLGGSNADAGYGIAVDGSGAVYICGQTSSTDFPVSNIAYQKTNLGTQNAFITKFSPSGSSLVFSTYLGGEIADSANAIAIDGSGNVYVAGGTGSDLFPTTPNAFQKSRHSSGTTSTDAFISKLDSTGANLLYSTYAGGTQSNVANAIAVDTHGFAYVAGETTSTDFPTVHGLQGTNNGATDGFIVKVDTGAGGAFAFADYLGGKALDSLGGIGLDGAGNIYVTGFTDSTDFPLFGTPYQNKCGTDGKCNVAGGQSQFDAVLAAVKADLSGYIYSTYYGGSGSETPGALAVDNAGNAFIAGGTSSTDLPLASAYQSSNKAQGGNTVFVAEMNPTGSSLKYATYLGGSGTENGLGVAIDSGDNIYVTGQTTSTDFPTVNPVQIINAGKGDAFVSVLNPTASSTAQLVFSSYLGGAFAEDSNLAAIAVDSHGNIYITGDTQLTSTAPFFPTLNAFQSTNHGGTDAFVTKINPAIVPAVNFSVGLASFSPSSVSAGTNSMATVTVTSNNGFSGTVLLGCNITPSAATPPTCTLSKSVNVSPNNPGSATLTFKTVAPTSRPIGVGGFWLPLVGFAFVGSSLLSARRKSAFFTVGALLLLALLLALPGCVASSSHGGGGGGGTTPGSYGVIVSGGSNGANATSPSQSVTVQ
jgi:hypothetical protein